MVPCYNAAVYIDSFINHIQTLAKPFDEVIFYDDASTDNTTALLLSKGCNVIRGKTNKGPGYARNRLAEAATSNYIHFHDIDDEFNPGYLTWVWEKIINKPADVILGYADWIDSQSRKVLIKWRYNENDIVKHPLAYFIANPLGVINVTYKKLTFLETGGFNEEIKCWEDADLHVRLAAAGAQFTVIDKVVAYSIRHNNGISHNQQWCWSCRLKFIKLYLLNYRHIVDKEVFKTELKRIQTAFVNMGLYPQLNQIIKLNHQYSLGISVQKINILYYLNKIIPAAILQKTLRYLFQ